MDIMDAQGATCVTGTPQAIYVSVRGVVQGVGFRPFVYRIAINHHLQGWVCNTSGDVRIDVEGAPQEINWFLWDLENQAPPQARIESISTTPHSPKGYQNFEIHHSLAEDGEYQLISPDIATCEACKKELVDPHDRRHRYPFTNCTNCGPRFTIIEDIPYDRPKTTMNRFRMCPKCQEEYDDPLDRRFHAQPNACPRCGPSLQLVDCEGHSVEVDDPLKKAADLILEGKIVALKGLGGFLLACDATNEETVDRLRHRKKRPSKPLAVMMVNLEQVHQHCDVSLEEEALLISSRAPIVLLKWKHDPDIASSVAPNLDYLGVMLPYTPMHHVLLEETGIPLVMTSGNLSEEPIAKDNDEALERLGMIADYLLIHNRGIFSPYDDSVVFCALGKTQLLRRARGYAPYPIHLSSAVDQVLACGPHLKNTICFTKDNYAFVSQHIGDLENLETLVYFEKTIDIYKHLFRLDPQLVACDMHPEYISTKYAKNEAEK
ncbi:MAG: carbamoyltransferase HypF, partial [Chloroflexota bacterium]|nr:carbamoyltransferase HypF [Chloroflexota bacterium]